MYDFLADLDEYFCEKYANYDKLCSLPGYRMPKMQTSEVRKDGRTYAYTLPAETMRLALQEEKTALLSALKEQLLDKTFSFSFEPVGFFRRIGQAFSKYAFYKNLKIFSEKNGIDLKETGDGLSIAEEIWQGICKGKFLPSKNLLFSIALTAHISLEDTQNLMLLCGYEFDYAIAKDVVVDYLLCNKVYNRGMIDAALAEYKVEHLFLK